MEGETQRPQPEELATVRQQGAEDPRSNPDLTAEVRNIATGLPPSMSLSLLWNKEQEQNRKTISKRRHATRRRHTLSDVHMWMDDNPETAAKLLPERFAMRVARNTDVVAVKPLRPSRSQPSSPELHVPLVLPALLASPGPPSHVEGCSAAAQSGAPANEPSLTADASTMDNSPKSPNEMSSSLSRVATRLDMSNDHTLTLDGDDVRKRFYQTLFIGDSSSADVCATPPIRVPAPARMSAPGAPII